MRGAGLLKNQRLVSGGDSPLYRANVNSKERSESFPSLSAKAKPRLLVASSHLISSPEIQVAPAEQSLERRPPVLLLSISPAASPYWFNCRSMEKPSLEQESNSARQVRYKAHLPESAKERESRPTDYSITNSSCRIEGAWLCNSGQKQEFPIKTVFGFSFRRASAADSSMGKALCCGEQLVLIAYIKIVFLAPELCGPRHPVGLNGMTEFHSESSVKSEFRVFPVERLGAKLVEDQEKKGMRVGIPEI
ncbi:hypothetical protein AgCh_029593 [Apium graveolens]